MNIVLLKNYNNYFNRIIKSEKTLQDYLDKYEYEITPVSNFIVADGIDTTHVFNMKSNFVPDYALLIEPNTKGGFDIVSKWFIMHWEKISGKQYRATLHNDVVASNLSSILKAPIFVEKGSIGEINSLLFNNEGMTYNQIKKKEIPLKDESRIAWLVGYYIQNDTEQSRTFDADYDFIEGTEPIIDVKDIDSSVIINFPISGLERRPTYARNDSFYFELYCKIQDATSWLAQYACRANDSGIEDDVEFIRQDTYDNSQFFGIRESEYNDFKTEFARYTRKTKQLYQNIFTMNTGVELFKGLYENEINKLNNRIIRDTDGKLYRLRLEDIKYKRDNLTLNYDSSNENIRDIQDSISIDPISKYFNYSIYQNKPCCTMLSRRREYYVMAERVELAKKSITTTFTQLHNHLNDAPYDMFCIPYDKFGDETRRVIGDSLDFEIINSLSLTIAKGIASQSGGVGTGNTVLYDMQLLPYCPIQEVKDALIINDDGSISFDIKSASGFEENKDYNLVYDKSGETLGDPVSIIFWATKSSGTLYVPYENKVSSDPLERKIENETKFIRLCSPNYSGIFEMSPAKNDGINFINVDYTYKPFNPYIHINPDFKGLYGNDFNDSRGLIVGGDFSIGMVTDRWAQYELANKNYQQMFDREIQNMEINNNISLVSNILSGLVKTGGAAAGGAAAGMMAGGGPAGAVIGGVLSGAGSLAGAGADIAFSQLSYREQKSYKTDMFGYQLGNIKALPASLAKTTAFTFNNKVFPFIEEYDCTEEERDALRLKIKYEGMTVMKIGKLSDYVGNEKSFFKGRIIRLDDLCDDSHLASVIADELNKGVYI